MTKKRGEKPTIHKSMERFVMLETEVRTAIAKKLKKTARPDEILRELPTAKDNFRIDKVSKVIH